MKLPEKIKGRHKIRDFKICLLWDREGLSAKDISDKVKMSQRSIERILRANHVVVPIDKEWERRKIVRRLQIEIKAKQKSNKDVADLMEQLNRMIGGDKENGGTVIEVYITNYDRKTQDLVTSSRISGHPAPMAN